jgi:enoyl-CoA hydratase
MSATEGVAIEREGAILVVRIANPPLNLLTQEIRRALGDALGEVASDETVRAVILASGAAHFCAGADMTEFPLRFDPAVARSHGANGHRMMRELARCPKPTVAAIKGACLGGGMELALACDVRVAAASARLGLPEIHRGIWPGTGGLALLARLVGEARAKAIVLDGDVLSAATAATLGLVDQVVDDGEALGAARQLAARWSDRPAMAVRAVKQLLDAPFLERFDAHLARELEAYVAAFQTADAREGNAAFFARRAPRWSHH